MKIAVDVSLYPLDANYVAPIKDFIDRLGRRAGIALEVNALSTQVRGEVDAVFDALRSEVSATLAASDAAVFVLKVVGGRRALAPHAGR